jgi:hypothetical protein
MNNALSLWGNRDDVRELSGRLVKMALPGGHRLSEPESLALAQASLAHGLDPFNGEIWMIPNTGLMIGIKGLRKSARKKVQGNYWTEFRRITDPAERNEMAIPDGALAYECSLYDTETINTYTATIEAMRKTDMPWDTIMGIVGSRPRTQGIGYHKRGEPTKMTPVQCAMKRAEADALKRRFDVPFGVDPENDVAPQQIIARDAPLTGAELQEQFERNKRMLGQGDDRLI